MEKKYYDLIISKIKNNKKYSGLEAILEDIASHVFEQSKSIINTINDENVVDGYLDKLVNTAMVTVPRRLNYKRIPDKKIDFEVQSNKSEQVELETKVFSDVEPSENDLHEEIINTSTSETSSIAPQVDIELVEKMINGTSSERDDATESEETSILDSEALELYESLEEYQEEEEEEESSDDILEEISESVPLNESTDELNMEEEPEVVSETLDLDNSFTNPEEEESIENITEEMELEVSDSNEIVEPEEEIEEIEKGTFAEDFDLDNNLIELDTEEDEIILDQSLEEEETKNLDIIDSLAESNTELKSGLELESEHESETNNVDTISEDEDVFEEINLDKNLTELDIELTSEDSLETLDLEDNVLELDAENEINTKNNDFYKIFSFAPSKKEDISDEIENIIKELDKKYPEKEILNISYLKYNQKLSIKEISEKTGLQVDFITETLSEIINAVKD